MAGELDWTDALVQAARDLAGQAFAEDHVHEDVTSRLAFADDVMVEAEFVARQELVLAGGPVLTEFFACCDRPGELQLKVADGTRVAAHTILARVYGFGRTILAVERAALNILQHLSGIATLTRQFVDAVAGTGVAITDTRKTTPGLRLLEKYAVRCGGGVSHRMHLGDMILLKDNHWLMTAGSPRELVQRARLEFAGLPIAAEAETVDAVQTLVDANVDLVMLDNMSLEMLRAAVQICKGRVATEATGGVTLANVRAIAETGVNRISIGVVTHSAPAVDIALDVVPR